MKSERKEECTRMVKSFASSSTWSVCMTVLLSVCLGQCPHSYLCFAHCRTSFWFFALSTSASAHFSVYLFGEAYFSHLTRYGVTTALPPAKVCIVQHICKRILTLVVTSDRPTVQVSVSHSCLASSMYVALKRIAQTETGKVKFKALCNLTN